MSGAARWRRFAIDAETVDELATQLEERIPCEDVLEDVREDIESEQCVPDSELLSELRLDLGRLLALSKRSPRNLRAAVSALEELVLDAVSAKYTGECLLYIAIAYYGLGEYRAARLQCERKLKREPDDAVALALHGLIRRDVTRKGLHGLSLVLGVSILTATLSRAFLTPSSSHRHF